MGLIFPTQLPSSRVAQASFESSTLVEAAMLSQGVQIRVGPHHDDLCAVEDLSTGESIWDLAGNRLVDLDAMSCMTLDAAALRHLGFFPMPLGGRPTDAWIALSSARLTPGPRRAEGDFAPLAFFRLWPETRLVAEVNGQAVLIRPGQA